MDNLINETNSRLQDVIDNLTTIKNEYETKLERSSKEIEIELAKVNKYKEDFFVSKQKIEKMNSDIEGFEQDYQNLVDRFKDDELANILIAANKEISARIDERKRKIAKDKIAMNELVEKAELSKNKLVKITAEKKALELCLTKILDSYEFYTKALNQIISYSTDNVGNLSKCFYEQGNGIKDNFTKVDVRKETNNKNETIKNSIKDDYVIEETKVIEEESDNDNKEDVMTTHESVDMSDVLDNNKEIKKDHDKKKDKKKDKDKDKNHLDMDNIPSNLYDFNENIDLENIMNFDDSIES